MNSSKPEETKWQTIPDFCAEIGISRTFFYKLKTLGKAPKVTKLGFKALITPAAKSAWLASLSTDSDS